MKEEINLISIINIIKKRFLILFISASLIGGLSVVYALFLDNVYESNIVMAPKSNSQGIGGGLAGIAGLAGVSLPKASSQNNIDLSMSILVSKGFFATFFNNKDFLRDLLAFKSFNYRNSSATYDDKIFNTKENNFLAIEKYEGLPFPSFDLAYQKFHSHLDLKRDLKTNHVTITISHKSPYVAQQWATLIYKELNLYVKNIRKKEFQSFRKYLEDQLYQTSQPELRLSISKLIADQINNIMLTEASDDFVFFIVDSPRVPQLKASPNRPLICILITLFGTFIVFLFLLFRELQSN